jgi:CMP-N-acetylneuraminic acid synthetase
MKQNPLVTVYITNHNYGRFLRQAIESVVNQTYGRIEILIIDDGSTDGSREIVSQYAGLPNARVVLQENKGLNATNNVALRAARGDYFVRLDADDYMVPYAIAMMVALMEGNPDVGLVFPDYYYVDEVGNIIGVESRHDFDREVSLYDLPSHGACTMVRTEELRRLGGYNESFSCQDGYELWIKFILNSKVTNISKPLFYYRQHKSSLTRDESRILETRKSIKRHYVEEYLIPNVKAVAVVPVRPNTVSGRLWALSEFEGMTIIGSAIQKLVECGCFEEIIVTCSEPRILAEVERSIVSGEVNTDRVNVITHQRSREFELANLSLDLTLNEIMEMYRIGQRFEAIGLLGIETPLIKASTIAEAVHSLRLFKANSVICVRQDHSSYFTHNGDGMTLIFEKSRYTNYERKMLYRRINGFSIARIDEYMRHQSFLTSRLSHVLVGPEESLTIQSDMDFKLYSHLASLLSIRD